MTDLLAELKIIEQAAVDLATRVFQIRQATARDAAPVEASPLPTDLIEIGDAALLARRPPDTVRHWLRHNPKLGMKIKGRWLVSRKQLLAFIRS